MFHTFLRQQFAMEESKPSDDLLTLAISSRTATENLASASKRHDRLHSENPLLQVYQDMDAVRSHLTVLHGTDNRVDYIVYNDDHPSGGQEVYFDVLGYVVSFNLPGNCMSQR